MVPALLALVAGLIAISPAPVGVFWDDGVYVITAKALATGQGYRFIHLPGAPAATHYPPLWPAILSLVWRLAPEFPANVIYMRLLNPLWLAIAAGCSTVLIRRVGRVPMWVAALTAVTTIVVAPMLLLSAVLMSEPLCLALSVPAIYFATLVVMRGRARDAVIAGALTGLAVLARSAAIVILPSLAIGFLWKRSRTASVIAVAVALVFITPWFVWSSAHAHELTPPIAGSYGPYGAWLINGFRADPGLLPQVVAKNAATMFREIGVLVFGLLPRAARSPALALLLVTTLGGLFFTSRRTLPLLVTLAGYLVLVLVWPYAPGRFVWTYFALYAVAGAAAASALVRRARHRPSWRIPAGVGAVIAAIALVSVMRYDARGFQLGWHRVAIDQIANDIPAPVKWIAEHTAPTDTVATDVHLQAYLYANRIVLPITSLTVGEHIHPKSPDAVRREFAAIDSIYHPRWWVASGMVGDRGTLFEWASDSSSHLQPVAQLPNGGIAVRAKRP